MIRSVQFPLVTVSTNSTLREHWRVSSGRAAKQRAQTTYALADARLGGRPPLVLPPTRPNRFNVTLVRLSVAALDDDNIRGALKHVRDAVASWVQLDDRDPRIAWEYLQQKCPRGFAGVRVVIEDLDPSGDDRTLVLGVAPARLGAPDPVAPTKLPPAPKRAHEEAQRPLFCRRSFALLAVDQDGSGEPVFRELDLAAGYPPSRIALELPPHERRAHVPDRPGAVRIGPASVVLERRAYTAPELGGDVWVFVEAGILDVPQQPPITHRDINPANPNLRNSASSKGPTP